MFIKPQLSARDETTRHGVDCPNKPDAHLTLSSLTGSANATPVSIAFFSRALSK
jgi:hypothetical protein